MTSGRGSEWYFKQNDTGRLFKNVVAQFTGLPPRSLRGCPPDLIGGQIEEVSRSNLVRCMSLLRTFQVLAMTISEVIDKSGNYKKARN